MRSKQGFSIIEVLVATTVMAVGLAALAQLFALSVGVNTRARHTTMATVLARQKIEELRAEPGALEHSPPGALEHDTPGFYDVVDRRYHRRWSIDAMPSNPDAVVLQVFIVDHGIRLLSVKTPRTP